MIDVVAPGIIGRVDRDRAHRIQNALVCFTYDNIQCAKEQGKMLLTKR